MKWNSYKVSQWGWSVTISAGSSGGLVSSSVTLEGCCRLREVCREPATQPGPRGAHSGIAFAINYVTFHRWNCSFKRGCLTLQGWLLVNGPSELKPRSDWLPNPPAHHYGTSSRATEGRRCLCGAELRPVWFSFLTPKFLCSNSTLAKQPSESSQDPAVAEMYDQGFCWPLISRLKDWHWHIKGFFFLLLFFV